MPIYNKRDLRSEVPAPPKALGTKGSFQLIIGKTAWKGATQIMDIQEKHNLDTQKTRRIVK
jgi:hypothetical protein